MSDEPAPPTGGPPASREPLPRPVVAPAARPVGSPGPRPGGPRVPSRLASRARRRGGKGAVIVFLLMSIAPAGAAVWWFTRSEEQRQSLLDKIPSGVATRATTAGLSFALLLVLALVVLPGARTGIAALARTLAWFRARPAGARVALFPAELVVGVGWFAAQCLFAIDAVAILGAAAAFFLYVLRIIKPSMFPWLPG